MRKTIIVGIASLAVLAVPGALADRGYSDPAGDSGVAPDITAVSVGHDSAGFVTLTVTTNQPALAPDAGFWGYIDADVNASTGMPVRGLGADHFFLAQADGGVIAHVSGTGFTIDFDSTFTSSYAGGMLTARFQRSELGQTERFAFVLEADQDDADGNTLAVDYAPDGAPYEYSFAQAPLVVTIGKPLPTTGQPRAGKAFVVSAKIARSDGQPAAAGTATCRAKIGSAPLRAAGRVLDGLARCSMRIPKNAKGKTLRGTLGVSVPGASTATKPFSFRVR
jgi:hypothetical protein